MIILVIGGLAVLAVLAIAGALELWGGHHDDTPGRHRLGADEETIQFFRQENARRPPEIAHDEYLTAPLPAALADAPWPQERPVSEWPPARHAKPLEGPVVTALPDGHARAEAAHMFATDTARFAVAVFTEHLLRARDAQRWPDLQRNWADDTGTFAAICGQDGA